MGEHHTNRQQLTVAQGKAIRKIIFNMIHYCLLVLLLLPVGWVLSGCSNLSYYGQVIAGHWQLLHQRRPVDEVLADPATPPVLRQRLETARRLRDFASTELALPDNGSYRCYADLKRPYTVINVFAAPELSLQLREWCFLVIGCVPYRGYFDADTARQFAAMLLARGDDVYLAGIPAYSTLGWFDDPLLNTFVNWPTARLAELMFHELAHQRLFIAGDTDFNESFATAVGRLGTRHWLVRQGTLEEREAYDIYTRQQEEFLALVLATRDELARLYASPQSEADRRLGKARLLAGLQDRYHALKQRWNGYQDYAAWFAHDLNNAKLGSLHTYTRLVPAFEALFDRSGRDFAAFYQAAAILGRLPAAEREACLQALLQGNDCEPANLQRD
jgi:predicted aminopeptidase